MVQKVNNVVRFLSTEEVYRKQVKTDFDPPLFEIYKELEHKSTYELIDIATGAKNRHQRIFAVYLLGKMDSQNEDIRSTLWKLLSYENVVIRKEAIWALARLGDKKIQKKLINLFSENSTEFENNLTARLLGKIGDELSIEPLLSICINSKDIAGLSAGASIHEIIERIGLDPLLNKLTSIDPKYREEVVWLLSSRAKYLETSQERKKIIQTLLDAYTYEKDFSVRLSIAYNLSVMGIVTGTKELLLLCLSNQIDSDRESFFWNEVIRAFVCKQKQLTLKIIDQLGDSLHNDELAQELTSANQILRNLKKSIGNFDRIFDLL
ncbi:MAG: HEAT repeat domain-containing protein [Asgard group archaeon]|nr:HEAT repeat domain-containing protein [Asgard group archaeon]